MRRLTIMPLALFSASLLLSLPAHARLQTLELGANTLTVPAEQPLDGKHQHNQASGIYQYLGKLLGENFYRQLLESEEFVRMQEIAIGFVEEHYMVSYPEPKTKAR